MTPQPYDDAYDLLAESCHDRWACQFHNPAERRGQHAEHWRRAWLDSLPPPVSRSWRQVVDAAQLLAPGEPITITEREWSRFCYALGADPDRPICGKPMIYGHPARIQETA